MTNRQENSLSMYLTFKEFQAPYTEITNALPNFTTSLTLFENIITQIQTAAEQQKTSKKGVTENKKQLKEALIETTLDYARKLTAFAKFGNDVVLVQEVKFGGSKLRRSPDTAVRDYAQIVYNRAQAHLADLAEYNIDGASQTDLQNKITEYNASIGKPGASRVEGVRITQQMKKLFTTAEMTLRNMDTVVEIVRVSHSDFYGAYKNARKVVGRSGNGMAVKGMVVDASSGAPMKGVRLLFAPNRDYPATVRTLVKKTAEKGRFNIKSLASGMYTVTVQKMGYANQSTTVAVADGELTVLHFQLSKN